MGELIPLLAIICTIGLPIIAGWILGMQWIKSRNIERMGLINQGIIPRHTKEKVRSQSFRIASKRYRSDRIGYRHHGISLFRVFSDWSG